MLDHDPAALTVSDGALTATDTFVFRVSPTLATNFLPVCFVNSGESWRYWVQPLPIDVRTGQPINWTVPNVDERFRGTARTQLGFGSDGEVSVIPSTPLRITTYLRRHFTVSDPAAVTALKIRLLRDDGAAIYLNGTKVHTSNLPNTTLTSSTLARRRDAPGVDRGVHDVAHEAVGELHRISVAGGIEDIKPAVNAEALNSEAGIAVAAVVREDGFLFQIERAALHAVVEHETGATQRGGFAGAERVAHGIGEDFGEERSERVAVAFIVHRVAAGFLRGQRAGQRRVEETVGISGVVVATGDFNVQRGHFRRAGGFECSLR